MLSPPRTSPKPLRSAPAFFKPRASAYHPSPALSNNPARSGWGNQAHATPHHNLTKQSQHLTDHHTLKPHSPKPQASLKPHPPKPSAQQQPSALGWGNQAHATLHHNLTKQSQHLTNHHTPLKPHPPKPSAQQQPSALGWGNQAHATLHHNLTKQSQHLTDHHTLKPHSPKPQASLKPHPPKPSAQQQPSALGWGNQAHATLHHNLTKQSQHLTDHHTLKPHSPKPQASLKPHPPKPSAQQQPSALGWGNQAHATPHHNLTKQSQHLTDHHTLKPHSPKPQASLKPHPPKPQASLKRLTPLLHAELASMLVETLGFIHRRGADL